MLNRELRSQVDKVWSTFWSGGMANPLEIIEQITYLLFLKRLDDLQTLAENKSIRLKKPIEQNFFPKGKDKMRWSKLKNLEKRINQLIFCLFLLEKNFVLTVFLILYFYFLLGFVNHPISLKIKDR